MPVHKKRKTNARNEDWIQPLGVAAALTGAEKDDEERRLESLLFGKPIISGNQNTGISADDRVDAEGLDFELGRELENVPDENLFFFDSGEPSSSLHGNEDPPPIVSAPAPARNKAAWTDPDDVNVTVSLAASSRLRKLRDTPGDDVVGGHEYERRLRRQFERTNPTPEWALKARRQDRLKRTHGSSSSDEEDEDVNIFLSSTSGTVMSQENKNKRMISQGNLGIERLRDGNQAARSEGEVRIVRFHPSPKVPVLLTAGSDRRARLFNVDGHTNPHLHTLHIPSLPITTASFHPSGSSVILTGPRPFFYTYDLQSGKMHRSPRGLWGTNNPSSQDNSMETCAFSPTGDMLAVAGRRGYVHLVDWRAGGAQVIGSVKMNSGVRDIWWARGSVEGRTLMSLAQDSTVYIWDVAERRCVRRYQDEGGFGSSIMGGDFAGRYLAIGSTNGLINVYGPEGSSVGSAQPKPLKTLGNLTTAVSTLKFNHDSQLLAIASKSKKDQLRMIHLPSLTAFANWPTSSTPLGYVTSLDFAAGSEYVAIGNKKGRVLLYSLRNFGAQ